MNGQPSPSVAWFLRLLDAAGSGPIGKEPPARVRQCPAHADASPSLSVREGDQGQVWIKCHAGCDWRAILAALSLPACYLFTPPPIKACDYAKAFVPQLAFPPLVARSGRSPQAAGYHLDAIHDYGHEHRVLRWRKGDKKELIWETLRDGVWMPGLFGTPTSDLPLYREHDIRKAVALEEPVLLVESESSVDALTGWYATTWAGGAASPQLQRLAEVLGSYPQLVVIPDNDAAGLACLVSLTAYALTPHVLMPAAGEDARDLFTRIGPELFADHINTALSSPRPTERRAT